MPLKGIANMDGEADLFLWICLFIQSLQAVNVQRFKNHHVHNRGKWEWICL